MNSLKNRVILIGRLGQNPETKTIESGKKVTHFTLATDDSFKNAEGQRISEATWHNITAWNKLADLSKRFLTKGRQVYIEGRIHYREFTDRDGNKRSKPEITASQIVLLGSRGQTMESGAQPMEPIGNVAAESDQPFGDAGITDSDIPF